MWNPADRQSLPRSPPLGQVSKTVGSTTKSEVFPAHSRMSPSSLTGTTRHTPPALLPLFWHLLSRGSHRLNWSGPYSNVQARGDGAGLDPGDSNGVRRSERRQAGKASERVNRFDRGLGENGSQGSTKILGFRNLEGWSYHSMGWAAWGRSRCGGEEVMTMRSLVYRQVMFDTTMSHLKKIAQSWSL